MTMRNSYLDSCKAVLIFLVVLGHFLERLIGWKDPVAHAVLGSIYIVHMPAFIFISGMLFKDKNWLKNIFFFISLYLPFQILFPLFDGVWTGNVQLHWNVWERPYWILWYLLGMMVWTALAHILIKTKFALLMSLILAVLIGLSPWNNYQYSIGRIFTFFPFFMLGVVYGQTLIEKIQTMKFEYSAIGIFISIVTLVYFTQLSQFWLYGSLSYAQLNVTVLNGIWMRVMCLLISFIGVVALLSFIKLLKNKWIKLGQNTLAVYLLHGFVVMLIARYLKLESHILIEIGVCIGLSVLTCWLLQQQFFDYLLRKLSLWLMKPITYLANKK